MITTKEQVKTASPPYIIEKSFFEKVAKKDLLKLSKKFKKDFVLLDEEQMKLLRHQIHISEVRSQAGIKGGGRPRLPDMTRSELFEKSDKEIIAYKMRLYKREERARNANNQV
jgi:hypothetical protein